MKHKFNIKLKSGMTVNILTEINDTARDFQRNLIKSGRLISDTKQVESIELSLYQRCEWYECSEEEYVLLQFSDANLNPVGQLFIQIKRSNTVGWYAYGLLSHLGRFFITEQYEAEALGELPNIMSMCSDVSSIRVHVYCSNERDLVYMDRLLNRLGYGVSKKSYTHKRTAMCNVTNNLDEYIAGLSQKTRAKFRHKSRDQIEIKSLTGIEWVGQLQECLDAAFARTAGKSQPYNFDAHLKCAQKYPQMCLVLGLFMKSRPSVLVAYAVDIRHGKCIEATSSGSLNDAELRKTHFNYYLFIEKYKWSMDVGASEIDLGGVTTGGEGDPLASISSFKRNLTSREQEVGNEYEITIKKFKNLTFRGLVAIKDGLRL